MSVFDVRHRNTTYSLSLKNCPHRVMGTVWYLTFRLQGCRQEGETREVEERREDWNTLAVSWSPQGRLAPGESHHLHVDDACTHLAQPSETLRCSSCRSRCPHPSPKHSNVQSQQWTTHSSCSKSLVPLSASSAPKSYSVSPFLMSLWPILMRNTGKRILGNVLPSQDRVLPAHQRTLRD